MLEVLADACRDAASAEGRIREQLGPVACQHVSYDEVIVPLATALLQAVGKDPRSAVVNAGNATETALAEMAARTGTNIAGANGINAKLERLQQQNVLPSKLIHMGKYLGHIRNAADHGNDPAVGAAWEIRENTGVEYVYVACSFIAAASDRERGGTPPLI